MAAAAAKPRVYHISIWRYLLVWWVLGPFLLLGLTLPLIDPKSGGAAIAIACLIAPFLLVWHWFVRKTRLEISAGSLRLREVGGGMEVPWTDINGFRADRGHEGFITAQPMQSRGAENLAAYAGPMQMHDQRDLQLIGERRFIPIKPFACHLRHGDLREVIAARAPHLREALGLIDAPPAPAVPLTATEWRKKLLVAFLIALGPAIGVLLIGLGKHAQDWFFAVTYGVLGPLLALGFTYSAWQCWQTKRPVLAILTGLFVLVMIGWTIVNWQHVAQLLHHTH
jgi:hypothetical protein